jgi:hypothetical protein
MWPSHSRKSEQPSSEQELASKEKFPRVPSSRDSFLVITRVEWVDRNTGQVLESHLDARVEQSVESDIE